ncbi:hypothetical protein BBK36DRAFT_1137618 [Trichoderma citrinoviride]|uniref:Uncharacterized protein n=1 Tax=Trichoderma citrinoviride TaxID=58853 RepID=A0A2T4BNS5_9HYPO|nr:hypothetical protein BBK36DRAFT_1137618 [Trichoderma citrinoviride]PTB70974.1 hypothetical protein BBK36DRAFT_1137618 [Trichoderma citrinoviride]
MVLSSQQATKHKRNLNSGRGDGGRSGLAEGTGSEKGTERSSKEGERALLRGRREEDLSGGGVEVVLGDFYVFCPAANAPARAPAALLLAVPVLSHPQICGIAAAGDAALAPLIPPGRQWLAVCDEGPVWRAAAQALLKHCEQDAGSKCRFFWLGEVGAD